jgi:hypothetical protein
MDKTVSAHFSIIKMCHRLANARHLPYITAEEIENSLAAMWILRNELDIRVNLVDNAIAHMQAARGGKAKK